MSALVDMDDDSDVEALEVAPENSPDVSRITAHLDGLRTMKRELDFRGTLLGKTWSELSKLLGKYQSELVTKYDQFESMLGADGRDHVTRLESVIEKKQGEIERFEKTVHDLETKLLEKDGEIVHLRTDVHKLRNEVSIKDNLISKLQNQMAKESMEYSTEISSLKEIIELENSNNSLSLSSDSLDPSRIDLSSGMSRKKRRTIPNSMVPRRDDTPISAANTEGDSSLALSMSMARSSPAHASMPSPSSRLWRTKPSVSASSAQGAPGTRSSMATNASSAPTHADHGEFDIDQAVDTGHFLDIPTGQDITKVKMEITEDVMSALENPESTEGLDDYESQMMIQNVQSMATPVKQDLSAQLGAPFGVYENVPQAAVRSLIDNFPDDASTYPIIPPPPLPSVFMPTRLAGDAREMFSHPANFSCSICGAVFRRRCGLHQHLASHSNQRKFNCIVCSRAFLRYSTLKRHMLVHTKPSVT